MYQGSNQAHFVLVERFCATPTEEMVMIITFVLLYHHPHLSYTVPADITTIHKYEDFTNPRTGINYCILNNIM